MIEYRMSFVCKNFDKVLRKSRGGWNQPNLVDLRRFG